MRKFAHAAVLAAGFAAVSAVASLAYAADMAPGLESFGTMRSMSPYELSTAGANDFSIQPAVNAALDHSGARLETAAYGAALNLSSFAGSTALTTNLALDGGAGLDVAARFTNYGATNASPFLSAVTAPYLGLANGGRYTGVTFVPASNLRVRLGASLNSERLDRFSFNALAPLGNAALAYDAAQTRSLLGGLSWDVTGAVGLDITGISSDRSGVPLGLADAAGIAPRATTNALGVSAHMDIGQGWVTTASFSAGMTQLNQRASFAAAQQRGQSYSIAVAKHGLFGGDDTLGLSLSRPAPGMNSGFSSLAGSGDLPPLVISQASAALGPRAQETDIQFGYVTNFLDGAVALQTNAAYQTNFQGQPGATSVSLLSRAKIKF
jgi:hypothetical protein